jgi:3-oxoadipate enol-lactonase
MPYVKSNDTDIYYEVHGSGPPFLFIAETASVGGVWKFYQVPEFSRDHTVIISDHRGTGQSGKPLCHYTTKMFADDAAAVLDYLGVENAIVCGHSMGGRVAQLLALDHPRKVSKLIFASTGDSHPENKGIPLNICKGIVESGYEEFVRNRLVELGFPKAVAEKYPDEIKKYVDYRMANLVTLENFLRHVLARQGHDTSARLKEIKVPTLILVGDDEHEPNADVTHWNMAQALAQRLPNAKFVVLPGQKHRYFFVNPDGVHKIIREFLKAN